jgi:dCMP deaminase|tara:strand:- start:104 stop:526 length:423 start_codon:yes stop_codon:yes gene_type:complete
MDWDDYFYQIAHTVSLRSPDPDTKHGCIIVDDNNRIVSTGYNGPVKGFPNHLVQYTRPEKYKWMIHAEDNALAFAKTDLDGCKAYITGHPCCECFRRLVQAGITKVVYGSLSSKCISCDDYRIIDMIRRELGIEMLNIID